MFSRSYIDRAEVEQIGVGIVTVDLQHFGDETASRATVDLHDHVQRIPDICLDGAIGQFDTALQDTTCKACESLLRGTRVNCGECPGMARVQEL